MCRCFEIGGPFIAEDPECKEHSADSKLDLEQTVALHELQIAHLTSLVGNLTYQLQVLTGTTP